MPGTEKKKRRKKKIHKLPDRLIPVDNPDKKFHEKWTPRRNKLNIPHPARILAIGPPGVGKSWICGQMIIRSKPPFQELYVVHPDVDYTLEWEKLGATMLTEIPAPDQWEGKVKTMVVIDDLEIKQLPKEQARALDRLFGYCSTHKNITVYLTTQNFSNVPAAVRRMTNFWILWRIPDTDAMKICSKKAGLKKDELTQIFDDNLPGFHDSLWIDRTKNSPYPLRKNGFAPLDEFDEMVPEDQL